MGGVEGVLDRSRALGFLGPGPIEPQVAHASAYAAALSSAGLEPPRRCADLGSGGGLPGLVLAAGWPTTEIVLIDGSSRRCAFLEEAVEELGVGDRVSVRCGRAEELGHEAGLRATFDLIVARSFGAPPVLAECAAGLLATGGHLLVSEPPEGGDHRWPEAGLATLGMGPARRVEAGARFVLVEQVEPCSDRFPRRTGVPAKRPLF